MHAFILVNTKLLALFSSRNASCVRPADLLALILIVQDLYPSVGTLEDLSPEEAEDTTASEEYYTPEPSPNNRTLGGGNWIEDDPPTASFVDHEIQIAEDSLETLTDFSTVLTHPRRVFLDASLREGFCPMMPHSMYCMPLWPEISLVLLTKISSTHVALSVYQLLDGFTMLEKKLMEGQEVHQVLRSNPTMAELRQKTDKFVKSLGGREVQLQHSWHDFKTKAFSRSEPGTTIELLQTCRNVKRQLCSVYRQLFLAAPSSGRHTLSLNLQNWARKLVQEKLMDWKEFLLVKSKRNITMATYLEDFPGLVHFILVDRTTGQMVAPSMNIDEKSPSELGNGPLAHFIKNKVWSFIGLARRYLQKGNTTLTVRDGDYYCCFFLWFENEAVSETLFITQLNTCAEECEASVTTWGGSSSRVEWEVPSPFWPPLGRAQESQTVVTPLLGGL
ncbi:hypothetical protein FKM82_014555 [Ascaphus truei]